MNSAVFEENNEISLYIHLPYCENLCTYCGCNKRITKNHKVESPYIQTVLKEWALYLKALPARPIIKELHLGGGTPTFFSAAHLQLLLEGIFRRTKKPGHVPGFFYCSPFVIFFVRTVQQTALIRISALA